MEETRGSPVLLRDTRRGRKAVRVSREEAWRLLSKTLESYTVRLVWRGVYVGKERKQDVSKQSSWKERPEEEGERWAGRDLMADRPGGGEPGREKRQEVRWTANSGKKNDNGQELEGSQRRRAGN